MLLPVQWAVSQILSYEPLTWLAFIGVAASATYWGRWRGILAGQVLVAVLVSLMDVIYQVHYAQQMEMDAVFGMGVLARMLLINTTLMPVSGLALWLSCRKVKSLSEA